LAKRIPDSVTWETATGLLWLWENHRRRHRALRGGHLAAVEVDGTALTRRVRRTTVAARRASAALTPARTPILFRPRATSNVGATIGAMTEGEMLIKVFALTAIVGLLVTGSAAFIANHPHPVMACASACD
jgi:hypothetical protein